MPRAVASLVITFCGSLARPDLSIPRYQHQYGRNNGLQAFLFLSSPCLCLYFYGVCWSSGDLGGPPASVWHSYAVPRSAVARNSGTMGCPPRTILPPLRLLPLFFTKFTNLWGIPKLSAPSAHFWRHLRDKYTKISVPAESLSSTLEDRNRAHYPIPSLLIDQFLFESLTNTPQGIHRYVRKSADLAP
ncbi:hypothetical protein C8R47DRAFT_1128735 [Mycena vitilis]|nr:hypothetical protein C8R47DRAFT_1128735 [Mycena vitilis]